MKDEIRKEATAKDFDLSYALFASDNKLCHCNLIYIMSQMTDDDEINYLRKAMKLNDLVEKYNRRIK